MSPQDIFFQYFLKPIDDRTGYNTINTLTYAAIAMLAAYLIYKLLEKRKIEINAQFAYSIIPFILFGSAYRVITDAGYLQYSYFTVSPMIYIEVGLLTLSSVILFHKFNRADLLPKFGWLLFLAALLPLIPLFKNWLFSSYIILLAASGVVAAHYVFRNLKLPDSPLLRLPVLAHSLDGAATFISIDAFSPGSYFEQHVATNFIAQTFGGFWAFFLIKLIFSILAVYLIEKESGKPQEKNYFYLLLIIFGLAPGMRDLLRLLAGV